MATATLSNEIWKVSICSTSAARTCRQWIYLLAEPHLKSSVSVLALSVFPLVPSESAGCGSGLTLSWELRYDWPGLGWETGGGMMPGWTLRPLAGVAEALGWEEWWGNVALLGGRMRGAWGERHDGDVWGLRLACGLRELGGHRGWGDSGVMDVWWPREPGGPAGRGGAEAALGLGMDSGFFRVLPAAEPIPRAVGRGRLMLKGGGRQSSGPPATSATSGESWMALAAATGCCVLGTGAGQRLGGGRLESPEAGDMATLRGSESLGENEQFWFCCIGSINLQKQIIMLSQRR